MKRMKKLPLILFMLVFASSASATIYKWVDERGRVNFANSYSKVPLGYRDKVEEVTIPQMEPSTSFQAPVGNTTVNGQEWSATQPPPISKANHLEQMKADMPVEPL